MVVCLKRGGQSTRCDCLARLEMSLLLARLAATGLSEYFNQYIFGILFPTQKK